MRVTCRILTEMSKTKFTSAGLIFESMPHCLNFAVHDVQHTQGQCAAASRAANATAPCYCVMCSCYRCRCSCMEGGISWRPYRRGSSCLSHCMKNIAEINVVRHRQTLNAAHNDKKIVAKVHTHKLITSLAIGKLFHTLITR